MLLHGSSHPRVVHSVSHTFPADSTKLAHVSGLVARKALVSAFISANVQLPLLASVLPSQLRLSVFVCPTVRWSILNVVGRYRTLHVPLSRGACVFSSSVLSTLNSSKHASLGLDSHSLLLYFSFHRAADCPCGPSCRPS